MTFDPMAFWRNPTLAAVGDADAYPHYLPPHYVFQNELTALVLKGMQTHAKQEDSILEPGCNVGRNLSALKQAGYQHLQGIEINPAAVELGQETFDLDGIEILVGSIEETISDIEPVDWIFTQSVLMHLPTTSEWIFETMTRKAAKGIMTIEVERRDSDKFV